MAGELLGEGYVEIKPRIDAFKAELNRGAKKSLEDGVQKPAEKAEEAVEDLIDAAKKLGDQKGQLDIFGGVASDAEKADSAVEDLLATAKKLGSEIDGQGSLFEDVAEGARKAATFTDTLASNTKRAVLESRLLKAAQEAARKEAEQFADSEDEVKDAIKVATREAKKLTAEILESSENAEDFERQMLDAVKQLKIADTEAAQIADGMGDIVDENEEFLQKIRQTKEEAEDLGRRLDRVGDEMDRTGDEARQAETRIEGARAETDRWAGAARGVRTAVAGIVAGLGAREIIQGLRGATEAAIDFEGGLNEVFTLIPGADDLLRSTLSEGVREVAREFGQLPEDAIPALYNALSAGIPPGNVIEFLETSSKLAVGGVTDLNSGVNILTTAINAYSSQLDENGNALLDAGLASDILFTTVRLGKTTIDELNASLGQVLPTAAATGLKFEDVGAALAVLTANGLNTPRATTALNASLVELNKEGTKAFNIFEQASGQTFPDFIASGGNLSEGLRILSEEADATGTSILDIFPVEAARGALALTNNIDALDAATAEFNDTAGATDGAFNEIFEGDAFAVQQATAAFEDMKIELGQALLPTVANVAREFVDLYKGFLEGGVEGFIERLREIAPATAGIIERIAELSGSVRDFFSGLGDNDFLGSIFGDNFSIVDGIIAAIAAGAALIGTAIVGFLGPPVLAAFGTVFSGLSAPIVALVAGLGGPILAAFGAIFGGLGSLGLGGIVSSFGALTTTIGSKGLLGTLSSLIPSISTVGGVLLKLVTFMNPVALIGGLLIAAFVKLVATNAKFRKSLAALLPPIIAIGKNIVDQVIPVVKTLADVFLNEIIPAFEPVVIIIVEQLLPAIISLVGAIIENLLPVFLSLVVFFATEVLPIIVGLAATLLEILIPAIAVVIVWVVENLIPALAELVMWFAENVLPILVQVAGWIIENLVPALVSIATWIVETVIPALSNLWTWFSENILPILVQVGNYIIDEVVPAFTAFADFIVDSVLPALSDMWTTFTDDILPALTSIATYVAENVVTAFEDFWKVIETVIGWLSDGDESIDDMEENLGFLELAVGAITTTFDTWVASISGAVSAIGSLIGKAKELNEATSGGLLNGIQNSFGTQFFGIGLAEGGIVTRATAAVVGEDGPEVVVPLGAGRRDRLFELAKASGLDQIILSNFQQIESLPAASPSSAEFSGLSRAIDSATPAVSGGGSSTATMGAMQQQPPVRNFYIEASGVTIEEVINESEARADAELRADSVGV